MANQQVKRSFIREMQTETSVRCHFTPARKTVTRKTVSVDEDMERAEHLHCSCCVRWKMKKLLLRTVWLSVKKVNTEFPHAPVLPLL